MQIFEQRRVVDADHVVGTERCICHKANARACLQLEPALRKRRGTHFRSRQIREHRHDGTRTGGRRAHGAQPADVRLEGAVTEIEPHHVDTADQQLVEHFGCVSGRPQCRPDLRPGVHVCLSSSRWSCCWCATRYPFVANWSRVPPTPSSPPKAGRRLDIWLHTCRRSISTQSTPVLCAVPMKPPKRSPLCSRSPWRRATA